MPVFLYRALAEHIRHLLETSQVNIAASLMRHLVVLVDVVLAALLLHVG